MLAAFIKLILAIINICKKEKNTKQKTDKPKLKQKSANTMKHISLLKLLMPCSSMAIYIKHSLYLTVNDTLVDF